MGDITFLAEPLADHPRRLKAAFCLGQRPFDFRVRQYVNWQLPVDLWDLGREAGMVAAVDGMEEAFTDLAAAIKPNIYATLPKEIAGLRLFSQDFVDGLERVGAFGGLPQGRGPAPESPVWIRVCQLVPQALTEGSDLQRLLALGIALGRLQLAAHERSMGEPAPAPQRARQLQALAAEALRAATAIPARVVSAVPSLQTLQHLSDDLGEQHPADIFTRAAGEKGVPSWMRDNPDIALAEAIRLLSDDIETRLHSLPPCSQDSNVARGGPVKPHWNSENRTLSYRGVVCARYSRPAPRQTVILDSFQESNWPDHIDDPLDKGCLQNTIRDLQEKVRESPIIFERDGKGQGITWRPRPAG
jgi:hypothetical protein